MPGARKNTVFEYADEFAICKIPLNCGQLNNQQNFIFISTRPVEVKDVYYDQDNGTFEVEPLAEFHLSSLERSMLWRQPTVDASGMANYL